MNIHIYYDKTPFNLAICNINTMRQTCTLYYILGQIFKVDVVGGFLLGWLISRSSKWSCLRFSLHSRHFGLLCSTLCLCPRIYTCRSCECSVRGHWRWVGGGGGGGGQHIPTLSGLETTSFRFRSFLQSLCSAVRQTALWILPC